MRVPVSLSEAFGPDFQSLISQFAVDHGLLPDLESIENDRFVARSIVPHVQKLSALFNRMDPKDTTGTPVSKIVTMENQSKGLDPYWKESSNPQNMRMAYFLYFMPSNLYRVASIWAELGRLGFKWPEHLANPKKGGFRGIEFGAGPATGASGIAAGEKHAKLGLPAHGDWALIEQDRAVLGLGEKWAETYFRDQGLDWGVRPFHRKIDFSKNLLPTNAPTFHLWLSSYFLNEAELSSDEMAARLVGNWDYHLEEEGLAIIVEPALKMQSRKLLELRAALLRTFDQKRTKGKYQILLPCLGHQVCGALASENDWCHEEVSWWRPPYFKRIDEAAGLDRKSLPFSYLVVAKSARSREELLPALRGHDPEKIQRLVSPTHYEGRDLEFFICGQEGKKRTRFRSENEEIGRGTILTGAEIRGERQSTRIEKIKTIL